MFKGFVTDVFFDLDHTLWDFELNSKLTFKKIFAEYQIEISLDDFLEVYIPLNRKFWTLYRKEKITKEELRFRRLHQTFEELGKKVDDEEINRLSETYINVLSTFGNTLANAKEILNYLRPNYKLHIITNGFHEIQRNKIQNAGIENFFEVVMDSEIAGVKKPNPKIFKMALAEAQTLPEKSVMIGDDLEADIKGAINIGMQAIFLKGTKNQKQVFSHEISNLKEIKGFL